MLMLSVQALSLIMPHAGFRAAMFVGPLNDAMLQYDITGPLRVSAFLAQIAHESNELCSLVENLNYSALTLQNIFPKYFPTEKKALLYAHRQMQIANRVYAKRLGNGDEKSGDGWRYRGRGLLQITGRYNYERCGEALELDLLKFPEILERPVNAAMSAGWYWHTHALNVCADEGDIVRATKIINGGLKGLDQRKAWYARAKDVLCK